MSIDRIQNIVPGLSDPAAAARKATQPDTPETNFSDLVGQLLDSVNDSQQAAGKTQEAFLNGEPIDLHEVMIKAEEAGISMDLLLEVRNKLINGYNELIRMPM